MVQKFRRQMIGVAQGEVELFSEFSSGGPMWTGEGTRERRKRVTFETAFRNPPMIQVALSLWDMDSAANVRADIGSDKVTVDGFDLYFRTWSDTRVARVRMSWLAIGELPSEDDWEID